MPKNNGPSLYEALGNSFTIPTEEAGLRKVFDYFDKDRKGTIDYREFSKAYKEFEEAMGVPVTTRDIGRKFQQADTTNDNQLSFPEFAKFMIGRSAQ